MMRQFAIRTIRNGAVRIAGRTFRPAVYPDDCPRGPDPYHGELDGLRMAFGLYENDTGYEPFVSLWGMAKRYHGKDEELDWPGPNCDAQGCFHWEWWNAEE